MDWTWFGPAEGSDILRYHRCARHSFGRARPRPSGWAKKAHGGGGRTGTKNKRGSTGPKTYLSNAPLKDSKPPNLSCYVCLSEGVSIMLMKRGESHIFITFHPKQTKTKPTRKKATKNRPSRAARVILRHIICFDDIMTPLQQVSRLGLNQTVFCFSTWMNRWIYEMKDPEIEFSITVKKIAFYLIFMSHFSFPR